LVNISIARAGSTKHNDSNVVPADQRATRDHRRGVQVMIGLPADGSPAGQAAVPPTAIPPTTGFFGSIRGVTHRFLGWSVATDTTVRTVITRPASAVAPHPEAMPGLVPASAPRPGVAAEPG